MSLKEFDLSEYIKALEDFKSGHEADVTKNWGSVEAFEEFIQKIKDDESNVAQLAIKQYGSVEAYTKAMKYNLEHFSEVMEQADKLHEKKDEIIQRNNELYENLTKDLTQDPASDEIQTIVDEIVAFTKETSIGNDLGEGYWTLVIESYARDDVRDILEKKYGAGSTDFITKAFQHYFHK